MVWVSKSVLFKGDLIGREDLTIDGHVEGTIKLLDHSLTVTLESLVQADIVAKNITVVGTVIGSLIATETVDVRESGSVEGHITSRQLVIADGAVLRARVDTGPRDHRQDRQQGQLEAVA